MDRKYFRAIVLASLCMAVASVTRADEMDSGGLPVMYLRGEAADNWQCLEQYRMKRVGDIYSISLPRLDGEFKVGSSDWHFNYGSATGKVMDISDAMSFRVDPDGANLRAVGLTDVEISFKMKRDADGFLRRSAMRISANGNEAPDYPEDIEDIPGTEPSGSLPVLYINVYDEQTGNLDNEIIDRNLSHKNYFAARYWLDLNGCEWMEAQGASSIGSAEEPLDLQIKARGNYTRTGFSKKPFKLKLGAKQKMLGLSKSKHFALLAHADDGFGFMRNFTGFSLGRRIGLPWTPSQQPVEVVINGNYRGLYFLTESIRVEGDRIDIAGLEDNSSDKTLCSGGYLVELDNYDEPGQIVMEEKGCVDGYHRDALRITPDTPEEYSDLQRTFVSDQFTAMNDLVGANSDELWSYLDLDDAARYYIVEEIISHTESYHGSTYLFRDRGADRKWHFSPLWDCGNAFSGATDRFFYDNAPYGNTWISSFRANDKFNDKVRETWLWFMATGYAGLDVELDDYSSHISRAAAADAARWKNAQLPDSGDATPVRDNSDIQGALKRVKAHLEAKTRWLCNVFGDYTSAGIVDEPSRDMTPAAPLPAYLDSGHSGLSELPTERDGVVRWFSLQGEQLRTPVKGEPVIEVRSAGAVKVIY